MLVKLIKNGEVYAPEYIGKKDILIAGGKIAAIAEEFNVDSLGEQAETVDATGLAIIPGLIDGHVHITGGGGEGSFKTRTPELQLSDCIQGGVTTVVGVLGTDGSGRTMSNLVAKAKGLTEEGITCYCMSGNYHLPVKTLTGSVETDIMFIQEIIGAGEIAIADHRSSQPTKEEIARLASEARIGGMLSGKGGAVIVHVGDGEDKLRLLEEIGETTDLPIQQFIATHINRTRDLLKAGITYAKKGGYVDFTTSSIREDDELNSARGLKQMLASGVPLSRISFTSDGQGSLPKFNANGEFVGLGVGKVTSLYEAVKQAVLEEEVPLEQAIQVATLNPANMLKLSQKGSIKESKDADLVFLNKGDLSIETVMAMGEFMMKDKQILVKGTFEEN